MVALWETAPAMYNMPTTIEFHGNLQVDTLKLAIEHVVKQQEGLRTIVQFKGNKVMQKVLPEDLSNECLAFVEMEASNDEEARLTIEKESGFIFDLTKPPGEYGWKELLMCNGDLVLFLTCFFVHLVLQVIRAVLVKTPNSHLLLLNQHVSFCLHTSGWYLVSQHPVFF